MIMLCRAVPYELIILSRAARRHVVVQSVILAELKRALPIVHPVRVFRSNAQIATGFACRNRPRINCNNEFACVYLCLRAFAFVSTVRDRPRARTCMRSRAHAYICARCERHLKSIK